MGQSQTVQFLFKSIIEKIFSFRRVDHFNEWLMNKSIAYWKRSYGHAVASPDFEIAFRSTAGISKSHPNFSEKVLLQYDQKIKDFETENGMGKQHTAHTRDQFHFQFRNP